MKKKPKVSDLGKLRKRKFLTVGIKERLKNRRKMCEDKIRIIDELLKKPIRGV